LVLIYGFRNGAESAGQSKPAGVFIWVQGMRGYLPREFFFMHPERKKNERQSNIIAKPGKNENQCFHNFAGSDFLMLLLVFWKVSKGPL